MSDAPPEPAPRPKRRRRSPVTAALAIAACLFGLWTLSPDLLYALEGEPEDLGGSAAPLDPSRLRHGRHVRLAGPAEGRLGVAARGDERRAIVPLAGAPVVVLRPEAAPESPLVEAEGRLLRGDRAGPWSAAAEAVAARRGGGPASLFVLVVGEAPSLPPGKAALALLLAAVLGLNVAALAARFRR